MVMSGNSLCGQKFQRQFFWPVPFKSLQYEHDPPKVYILSAAAFSAVGLILLGRRQNQNKPQKHVQPCQFVYTDQIILTTKKNGGSKGGKYQPTNHPLPLLFLDVTTNWWMGISGLTSNNSDKCIAVPSVLWTMNYLGCTCLYRDRSVNLN